MREAGRDAIRKWTEETSGIPPGDPIFKLKSVRMARERPLNITTQHFTGRALKVFLGAGSLVALHNGDDEHHFESQNLFVDISSGKLNVTKLYCSDYVLGESITTSYARTRSRTKTIQLGEAVQKSRSIVILSADTNIFNESWRLFTEKISKCSP